MVSTSQADPCYSIPDMEFNSIPDMEFNDGCSLIEFNGLARCHFVCDALNPRALKLVRVFLRNGHFSCLFSVPVFESLVQRRESIELVVEPAWPHASMIWLRTA